MNTNRVSDALRWLGVLGLVSGIGFLLTPANPMVEPLAVPALADSVPVPAVERARSDSLTEDIILYNLFSPSRSAPSRRYAAGTAGTVDANLEGNPSPSMASGFTPELIGTAVSERPAETRALLRLLPADPAPQLYAVGDRAGGYTVVSIDARAVVLSGPRGRVVLRLPENEENHS